MDLQTLPVVKHIGRLKYATGWKNSSTLSTNVFFLVVSGEFCFRTSKTNFIVPDKTMLFLPAGTSYTVKVDRDCDYFYLHLDTSQKAVRAFSGSKDAALGEIQPPACRKEEKTVRFNEIISFDDDAFGRIFYLFSRCLGAAEEGGPYCSASSSCAAAEIILCAAKKTYGEFSVRDRLPPVALKVRQLIAANYTKPVTLATLAEECGVSKQYVMRVFKKCYGVTVTEYINGYKLQKAADLLRYTALGVGEIAYSLGYGEPYYFCRLFKRKFGVSPARYRKNSDARQ